MIRQTVVAVICGGLVGSGLVWLYRWMRERSPLLGALFAAGLLLQAGIGVVLFWTSYLDLPVLRGLHTGDGFWAVAQDARLYVARGSDAMTFGLSTVYGGETSPAYVRMLAAWMFLFGTSPAVGLFLNMTLYAAACGLVVWACRRRADVHGDAPCALVLGSLTFSPILLMHGTQPLKDNVFVALLAAGCVGLWLVLPVLSPHRPLSRNDVFRALAGTGVLLVALVAMSGIRAYYAFLLWCSLAVTLAVTAAPWQVRRLWRTLPAAAALLGLAWMACVAGAWSDSPAPSAIVAVLAGAEGESGRLSGVTATAARIEQVRIGFEQSGGATNVAVPPDAPLQGGVVTGGRIGAVADSVRAGTFRALGLDRPEGAVVVSVGPGSAAERGGLRPGDVVLRFNGAPVRNVPDLVAIVARTQPGNVVPVLVVRNGQQGELWLTLDPGGAQVFGPALEPSMGDLSRRLAVGLLTVFVPISLLEALSVVDVDDGRGLLAIADADTVFVDATILAVVALLYRRWPVARQRLPYIAVLAVLGAVSALMLGYVITNYGTLFRLRAMVVAPFWMMALAAIPDRASIARPVHAPLRQGAWSRT